MSNSNYGECLFNFISRFRYASRVSAFAACFLSRVRQENLNNLIFVFAQASMCIVMLREGWRKKLESRWEIDGNGAIRQQQQNFVSIEWDWGVYRGTSQSNWNVQNNGEKRNNESFSDRRSRFRNLCSELYEFFSVNFLQCQLYPARRLDWTGTDSMHSEQAQNTCAFIGNISSYSCFIISQILRTYSCLHFTSHCNKSPRSAHSKNFYGVHVDVENSNKRIASKLIVYAPLLPWISL